jgi:hypothetical protein
MALSRLPPVVFNGMHCIVAGVERSRHLPQRVLLPGSSRPFEQDDGTTAVDDLRQLKIAQMDSQRFQRLLMRVGEAFTFGYPFCHEPKVSPAEKARDRRAETYPQFSCAELSLAARP